MKKNKIQFIIDENGKYIQRSTSEITANTNDVTIIEVVAPFLVENSIVINYLLYDLKDKVLYQYLESTGELGSDVVDPSNTIYPEVSNYNVFRIPVKEVALNYISKYNSGKIGISFSIREKQVDRKGTNFKGLFGSTNRLPDVVANGDYYECDLFTFSDKGLDFTRGDIAYYENAWKKGNSWLMVNATETINIAVNPSIKGYKLLNDVDENDIKNIVDEWNIKLGKEVLKELKINGITQPINSGVVDMSIFDVNLSNPTDIKAPTTKLFKDHMDSETISLKKYADEEIKDLKYVDLTSNQDINGVKNFTGVLKANGDTLALEKLSLRRMSEDPSVTLLHMWGTGANMASFANAASQGGVYIAMTIKGSAGGSVAQIGFTEHDMLFRKGYTENAPSAWKRVLYATRETRIDKKYKHSDKIKFKSERVCLVVETTINEKINILGKLEIELHLDYDIINIPAFNKGVPINIYLEKSVDTYILNCPEDENISLAVYE